MNSLEQTSELDLIVKLTELQMGVQEFNRQISEINAELDARVKARMAELKQEPKK